MKLNQETMTKILDSIYDNVLLGLPGQDSVFELADDYLKKNNGDIEEASLSLIRYQIAKCSTSGFLTGLGGLITLPIAVPLDLSANYFIQMRMIAAIAHMNGYDVKSGQVKILIYCCLLGDACKDVMKNFGIQLGKKLTESAIKSISKEVIVKINQAVGFRLVTKFGEKGLVNMGKMIPLFGGVIGASFDGYYCNNVGDTATTLFAA